MRRTPTTRLRKDTARAKLSELYTANDKARDTAKRSLDRLHAGMLKAYDAGLTYVEIAEICNVTAVRVGQVLAERRNGR